jgi:hypothetical protein
MIISSFLLHRDVEKYSVGYSITNALIDALTGLTVWILYGLLITYYSDQLLHVDL